MYKTKIVVLVFLMVANLVGATERLVALQYIERCYGRAFYSQEYEQALEHIDALLLISPRNVEYLREKAKMLLALKRINEAVPLFIQIEQVGGEPANKAIWEAYNWQMVTDSDKDGLKKLLSNYPHILDILSIEPYIRESNQHRVIGGYEASVMAKYKRMSLVEAKDSQTQNLVEKYASVDSLFSSPITTVSNTVITGATKIQQLTEAYNTAFADGAYRHALQSIEQLLIEQPNNWEYLREKVKMQVVTGEGGQAIEVLASLPDSGKKRQMITEACNWDRIPNQFKIAMLPNQFKAVDSRTDTITILLNKLSVSSMQPVNKKPDDEPNADSTSTGHEVHLTKTGKCYHHMSCSRLKSIQRSMTITEAKSLGFKPCSYCMK